MCIDTLRFEGLDRLDGVSDRLRIDLALGVEVTVVDPYEVDATLGQNSGVAAECLAVDPRKLLTAPVNRTGVLVFECTNRPSLTPMKPFSPATDSFNDLRSMALVAANGSTPGEKANQPGSVSEFCRAIESGRDTPAGVNGSSVKTKQSRLP